jgi:hypothetical protein
LSHFLYLRLYIFIVKLFSKNRRKKKTSSNFPKFDSILQEEIKFLMLFFFIPAFIYIDYTFFISIARKKTITTDIKFKKF